MRRQINNVISVVYSCIRMIILKLFHGKNVDVGIIERISPNVVLEVNRGGKLKLANKVRIHSGCKLKVRKGESLSIGKNVKVNYNCMVFCHDHIEIGADVEFGPNVLVYDHDHDFRHPDGLKADVFKTAPVIIGKNCWIGANTVILRGTVLGDNCVVGAAGSIIKGEYPAQSVIIQRRTTIRWGGGNNLYYSFLPGKLSV